MPESHQPELSAADRWEMETEWKRLRLYYGHLPEFWSEVRSYLLDSESRAPDSHFK